MKKILYIDDSQSNLKLMQDIFSEFISNELLCSDNAEEGIELARTYLPELILLDINMPVMDGYEALKVIKADAQLASIPVIAISAAVMPNQVEKGISMGFVDYISKPFELHKLIETIKGYV